MALKAATPNPPREVPLGALSSVARPKQARSQRTLQRLLDEAEALICEQGAVDVSIPELVNRAGSSVGGFYARFRDKDELLCALEERFLAQISAQIDAATEPVRWASASFEELITGLLEVVVGVYSERGALLRVFIARAARASEVWREGRRLRSKIIERVLELGLRHRARINHPEPARALELALLMLFGVLQQRAILGELRVGGSQVKNAELVQEFSRMIMAYLKVEPS